MRKLHEWVDKNGNKVYLNSTASNNKTATTNTSSDGIMPIGYFKSRFEKIYDHMVSIYGDASCDIRELSDLDLLVHYYIGKDKYRLLISSDWGCYPLELKYDKILIGGRDTRIFIADNTFNNYDELLDKLLELGIIKDKNLCESLNHSLAEEFKLYESLWR